MNKILDFVEQNYGITTTEIAKKLDIGRPTVWKYLAELEKKNLVKNSSGRTNENKWEPNKDNEIIATRKNIYKFKESYYRLLKSSSEHPQFINTAYKLKPKTSTFKKGIHQEITANDSPIMESSETGIWDDRIHQGKIIGKMYEEIKNAEQIYAQKKAIVKKTQRTFDKLVNIEVFEDKKKLISPSNQDTSDSIPANILPSRNTSLIKDYTLTQRESNVQMSKTYAELILSNINQIKKLQVQYCLHLKNSGHLALTYWPVLIFFLLEYFITLKSISKWPSKIKDKDLLFELNEFVYKQFMEIKEKLLDFLSKGNYQAMDIETMMQNIDPLHEEEYFVKMFHDYSCLGMKPFIKDIFNSLIKIREKEIGYNEQRELDQIYNTSNELLDLLNQLP
jgi:DNA-binding Lrp family transcriptional regulator